MLSTATMAIELQKYNGKEIRELSHTVDVLEHTLRRIASGYGANSDAVQKLSDHFIDNESIFHSLEATNARKFINGGITINNGGNLLKKDTCERLLQERYLPRIVNRTSIKYAALYKLRNGNHKISEVEHLAISNYFINTAKPLFKYNFYECHVLEKPIIMDQLLDRALHKVSAQTGMAYQTLAGVKSKHLNTKVSTIERLSQHLLNESRVIFNEVKITENNINNIIN